MVWALLEMLNDPPEPVQGPTEDFPYPEPEDHSYTPLVESCAQCGRKGLLATGTYPEVCTKCRAAELFKRDGDSMLSTA